ncbi:MAG TPA: DnaD domain protein [Ktedonobacteraceae bacterium]|jgi:DnaD/phage-associated family protein|nr:DnaD domain protein [Ktedonobacteraceae bacterium]
MTFTGFPTGKNPYVPVPEVFFTQLVPVIEDSAELKVTLHLFWLLAHKQGNPRCTSDRELLGDQTLLQSLKRRGDPRPSEERLRQGLEQALARGTLLRIYLRLVSEGKAEAEVVSWYFFNTAKNRKIVNELQGGEMIPARLLQGEAEHIQEESTQAVAAGAYATAKGYASQNTIQVEVERPNIFVLYEQNIGLLSPLIADELKDAAEQYSADWIEAAFREAVQNNKRNWKYIHAILRRWETEGRQQSWNA